MRRHYFYLDKRKMHRLIGWLLAAWAVLAVFWFVVGLAHKAADYVTEYTHAERAKRAAYQECMSRQATDPDVEEWRAKALCEQEWRNQEASREFHK